MEAVDIFVDRILNYVGAYFIKLDGRVDALVFAGGIGEKSVQLREAVVERVACLGFELDEARNADVVSSREGAVVVDVGLRGREREKRVLVCWTDEQVSILCPGCPFTPHIGCPMSYSSSTHSYLQLTSPVKPISSKWPDNAHPARSPGRDLKHLYQPYADLIPSPPPMTPKRFVKNYMKFRQGVYRC